MDTRDASLSSPPSPTVPRWRIVTAWLLLVLFCLGMVLSTATIWARTQALDTDAYVETVTPLAADPDIQQAIATRVTALIGEQLQRDDVLIGSSDGLVRQLAMPIALDFVHQTVLEYVQSPEFQTFWVNANALAHEGFVSALTSDAEQTLTIEAGRLILDLSPLVTQVNERLQASGFDAVSRIQVDPARATFVLFESETLADIQQGLEWLDTLAIVLPVVTLVALAGCLVLARDRWGMAMWAALGVAIGMVLLALGLQIGREAVLDALPPERSTAAVASVFDIVGRELRDWARLLTVLSLVVAAACGIAGSAWIRQARVVTFFARYRAALIGGIVAASCLALTVPAGDVSPRTALGVGIVALAGVIAVIWVSRLRVTGMVPGVVDPRPERLPNQAA